MFSCSEAAELEALSEWPSLKSIWGTKTSAVSPATAAHQARSVTSSRVAQPKMKRRLPLSASTARLIGGLIGERSFFNAPPLQEVVEVPPKGIIFVPFEQCMLLTTGLIVWMTLWAMPAMSRSIRKSKDSSGKNASDNFRGRAFSVTVPPL